MTQGQHICRNVGASEEQAVVFKGTGSLRLHQAYIEEDESAAGSEMQAVFKGRSSLRLHQAYIYSGRGARHL
jgi:hypothetical protein